MKKVIYLDTAATTPVQDEVLKAMSPFWSVSFGNPSSITKLGVQARYALETARLEIAELLNRRPKEIIFTSGGTESNNLAIFGVINELIESGQKISDWQFVTSNIEHSSVLECFREIEKRGGRVIYLPVDSSGLINSKDLRKVLKNKTALVSIGYANNEIGTVQPIIEIAREIRHARAAGNYPYFHTDASQAPNYLDLNLNKLGVDLLTIDGQKIGGPKGVGALFVKAGTKIKAISWGGGQEAGLRPGTENLALIVGLAAALKIAIKKSVKRSERVKKLRDYFLKKITAKIPDIYLNGSLESRLPNNLNLSFLGVDPEFLVLSLDEEGIVASTKSACHRDAEESYVIRALGQDDKIVTSAVRFSLPEDIKKSDIDFVIKKIYNIVHGYRETH